MENRDVAAKDSEEKVAEFRVARPEARAIDEISEAIRKALDSTGVNKFAEVSRLCKIGHQLQRALAEKLEDFAAMNVENQEARLINAFPAARDEMAPIMVGNPRAAVVDANAGLFNPMGRNDDPRLGDPVMRKLLLTLEPFMQSHRGTQAAQVAQDEASELKDLVGLRDALNGEARVVIEQRIGALVESIKTRNAARVARRASEERENGDGKLGLVSADVPRGHLVGAENGANDAR